MKSISIDIVHGKGAGPRGFTTAEILDNICMVLLSTPLLGIFLLFLTEIVSK